MKDISPKFADQRSDWQTIGKTSKEAARIGIELLDAAVSFSVKTFSYLNPFIVFTLSPHTSQEQSLALPFLAAAVFLYVPCSLRTCNLRIGTVP